MKNGGQNRNKYMADQDTLSPSAENDRSDQESLQHYINAASSRNTKRTYSSALRQFEKWGGRLPTDRDTIVQYLLDKARQLNPRSLELHMTAISQWHKTQGMVDPVQDMLVRQTIHGIRRTHGTPPKKAKALRLEHIATMLDYLGSLPHGPKKIRDRALLLTGFFGAFRRSEIAAIQMDHLIWEPEGLIILLPKSKTDQDGAGIARAIPYGSSHCCAASSIKSWIDEARIETGPLFRPINRWGQIKAKEITPAAINALLKTIGVACGFDFAPELSSHSFRRGLSTSAARENIDFALIKKQGGWKSDATVWGYIDEGQRLMENAAIPLMQKVSDLLSKQKEQSTHTP